MNQPLHESLTNKSTTTKAPRKRRRCSPKSCRRRQSSSTMMITALTAVTVATMAEDASCPPSVNGWAASADCKSYFWCSAGARSSITYTCIDSTEFDVASAMCVAAGTSACQGSSSPPVSTPAVETPAGIDWASNGVSPGQQLAAMTEAVDLSPVDSISAVSSIENSTSDATAAPASEFVTATPILQSATAPTNYPTKLGPPIYYGDFRTSSCLSAAADPAAVAAGIAAPDWLTEDLMYQSKEECCEQMFGWAPLESCLGDGWVETNYVIGSRSPTLSPTMTPTVTPSGMPTVSSRPSMMPSVMASEVPSEQPSYPPSYMPSIAATTLVPTISPTTEAPTTPIPTETPTTPAPTERIVVVTGSTDDDTETEAQEDDVAETEGGDVGASSNLQQYSASRPVTFTESTTVTSSESDTDSNTVDPNSFLVELLGWANSDSSTDNNFPTKKPSEKPDIDSFAISEIILPVLEDATISQQRQSLNFGANSALAVDGGMGSTFIQQGDGLGEKFDSLLKFDIAMIDRSRPLEKAVLRVYAVAGCPSGGTFVTTSDASWDQQTVTWESSPIGDGYEIGTIESVQSNTWYELDMMAALSWNDSISAFSSDQNVISIRISSSKSGRCMYSSMESGQPKAPYMSVRYGHSDAIQEFSSVMPPVSGQFILLRTTDDASIDATDPGVNFGTEPTLRVAFDMISRAISDVVIRFDLSELVGTMPASAVLSLYAEDDCPSAGAIMTTEGDSAWTESEVTWTTAPSYKKDAPSGGFNIGTFGQVTAHKWYGFDVVNAVKQAVADSKSALTFRISTTGDGECTYSSRESGRDPKLMVAF